MQLRRAYYGKFSIVRGYLGELPLIMHTWIYAMAANAVMYSSVSGVSAPSAPAHIIGQILHDNVIGDAKLSLRSDSSTSAAGGIIDFRNVVSQNSLSDTSVVGNTSSGKVTAIVIDASSGGIAGAVEIPSKFLSCNTDVVDTLGGASAPGQTRDILSAAVSDSVMQAIGSSVVLHPQHSAPSSSLNDASSASEADALSLKSRDARHSDKLTQHTVQARSADLDAAEFSESVSQSSVSANDLKVKQGIASDATLDADVSGDSALVHQTAEVAYVSAHSAAAAPAAIQSGSTKLSAIEATSSAQSAIIQDNLAEGALTQSVVSAHSGNIQDASAADAIYGGQTSANALNIHTTSAYLSVIQDIVQSVASRVETNSSSSSVAKESALSVAIVVLINSSDESIASSVGQGQSVISHNNSTDGIITYAVFRGNVSKVDTAQFTTSATQSSTSGEHLGVKSNFASQQFVIDSVASNNLDTLNTSTDSAVSESMFRGAASKLQHVSAVAPVSQSEVHSDSHSSEAAFVVQSFEHSSVSTSTNKGLHSSAGANQVSIDNSAGASVTIDSEDASSSVASNIVQGNALKILGDTSTNRSIQSIAQGASALNLSQSSSESTVDGQVLGHNQKILSAASKEVVSIDIAQAHVTKIDTGSNATNITSDTSSGSSDEIEYGSSSSRSVDNLASARALRLRSNDAAAFVVSDVSAGHNSQVNLGASSALTAQSDSSGAAEIVLPHQFADIAVSDVSFGSASKILSNDSSAAPFASTTTPVVQNILPTKARSPTGEDEVTTVIGNAISVESAARCGESTITTVVGDSTTVDAADSFQYDELHFTLAPPTVDSTSSRVPANSILVIELAPPIIGDINSDTAYGQLTVILAGSIASYIRSHVVADDVTGVSQLTTTAPITSDVSNDTVEYDIRSTNSADSNISFLESTCSSESQAVWATLNKDTSSPYYGWLIIRQASEVIQNNNPDSPLYNYIQIY